MCDYLVRVACAYECVRFVLISLSSQVPCKSYYQYFKAMHIFMYLHTHEYYLWLEAFFQTNLTTFSFNFISIYLFKWILVQVLAKKKKRSIKKKNRIFILLIYLHFGISQPNCINILEIFANNKRIFGNVDI